MLICPEQTGDPACIYYISFAVVVAVGAPIQAAGRFAAVAALGVTIVEAGQTIFVITFYDAAVIFTYGRTHI